MYNHCLFFLNLPAFDLNKTKESWVGGELSLLLVLLVGSTFVRVHVDCNYIKLLVQCLLLGTATLLANFRTTGAGKCCMWECQHCFHSSTEPLSHWQEVTWDASKCCPSLSNLILAALNNIKREAETVPAALRISPLKSEHKNMDSS